MTPASGSGGAGGTAPASGSGGAGGTAGGCDPAGDPSACDDGNACTLDRCDSSGECQHSPAPDATRCDDFDACTTDDRCLDGVCVGSLVPRSPEVLGQIDTFGGYEEDPYRFHGFAAVLSEEHTVLAEPVDGGMSLKLVRVSADGIELLDRIFTPHPLASEVYGFWGAVLGSHLVPLGETRVALVNSRHVIEIYDILEDRLALRPGALSDPAQPFIFSAAGEGDRLWTCDLDSLDGFSVSADGSVSRVVTKTLPDACNAIALSDDGKVLYMAGAKSLHVVDVSDPSSPRFDPDRGLPSPDEGTRYFDLDVQGDLLVVQARELLATGEASVLRTSDWHVVATFPSHDYRRGVPIGAVFVEGGLLLQKLRYTEDDRRELIAELHRVSDAGAERVDAYVYRDLPKMDDSWETYRPVANGRLAVLSPFRRIIWTDAGSITEQNGVQQGNLGRVRPGGPGAVVAYGAHSSHRIDISDPRAPRIVAGGLLRPGSTSPLRVDLPADGTAPALLNVVQAHPLTRQSGTFAYTQFDAGGATSPVPAGDFAVEGGPATLSSSAGMLFQLGAEGEDAYRLQVFRLPTTVQRGGELAPLESAVLPSSSGVDLYPLFAVDAPGGALVVARTDPTAADALRIEWFGRHADGWTTAASLLVPGNNGPAASLGVRGDSAVVIASDRKRIDVVRRREDRLVVERTRTLLPMDETSPYTERKAEIILGFNRDLVYISGRDRRRDTALWSARVYAFRLPDLELVAEYELPQVAKSMTEAGDHLVFGMDSFVAVASPLCAAP